MIKIAIRDDDINYYTDSEKLEALYAPTFSWLKPTLCVTPFAGAIYKEIRDVEDEITSKQDKHEFVRNLLKSKHSIYFDHKSIFDNQRLIELLKTWSKRGNIEIALHGITHNQRVDGFECEGPTYPDELIASIISTLEVTFACKINFFSPPNNSINRKWATQQARLGLNLIYSFGPRPLEIPLNIMSAISALKLTCGFLRNGRSYRSFEPFSLTKNLKFFQSIPLSPSADLDLVEEQISKLKKQNAKIVLATHSYACEHNAIFRENLLTLFRNLKNRGCHFTGISDLL